MIAKQQGWSSKSNVLYEIIKQLDRMISVSSKWLNGDFHQNIPHTTTTTTTTPPPTTTTSSSTTTTTTTPPFLYLGEYFSSGEIVNEDYLLDTSGNNRNFLLTRRNCLIGDGTAKLTFSNLPTYDSLTIVEDGITTAKSLTSSELVLDNNKKYNYAIFKNGVTEVAKFPLMEYDSDYSLPVTFNFYDVIGSAACVLTNGDENNIEKANGLSWNFKYGFAVIIGSYIHYPKKATSGYGGITNQSIIIKLPYSTDSNQYIKAPSGDAVFIAKDTDEQFYDAGVPVNIHLADVYNSDYIQITTIDNIITNLTISL